MSAAASSAGTRPDSERRPIVAADSLRMARGVGTRAATLAAYSIRVLYGVLVARLAGGSALGVYVLAFAWADLLSQVGMLGLDGAAMTFAARAAAAGRPARARSVLERAVTVALTASVAVSTALLVAAGWGLGAETPGLRLSLGVLAAAIPALAVARVSSSVAQGLGVMEVDFYANGVVGTVLMPIGFLVAFALGAGPASAAIGATAGALGAALAAWWGARRLVASQPDASAASGPDLALDLVRYARPIAGVSVLSLVVMRLDILALGWFAGSTAAVTPLALGAYAAAADLAGGFRKLRQLFDAAFAPVAAQAQARGERDGLEASFRQVAGWMLLLACPAACLAFLAGGAALRLYDSSFGFAAPWLAVLAAATAAHGFLGLFETILMTRRPALNLRNSSVAVVVQAAVSVALIPRYGPIGAALGVLSAYTIQALLRVAAVRTTVGLGFPWRSLRRPAQAAALALIPAVALRALLQSPAGEVAAAVGFLAAYVGALRMVGLERDDTALLGVLMGRRGRRDEET